MKSKRVPVLSITLNYSLGKDLPLYLWVSNPLKCNIAPKQQIEESTCESRQSGGKQLENASPCPGSVYQEQSDVDGPALGTSELSAVSESTTTIMSFLEKSGGYTAGFAAELPAESYADATPDVGLGSYFSRPVRIHTYTWNEADVVGLSNTINPWTLFFQSPGIKDKLTSYAFLKCDLKLKIMLNASPFYYGATLASYQPLPNFHQGLAPVDAGNRHIIALSQRPHIWLYPQNNEGGEMTLPFITPKNWISTLSASEFNDMGALTFTNTIGLESANGAVGTGVTVSVYAWAENVVVSGATVGLVLQADEYGVGSVSSMATAVAATMKALEHIPIIGKYATATQMGASATAAVASSLGFCNPPVIADVTPRKLVGLPPLASTEISYPVEKLTVDPKNELSVDPAILGLPSHDELNIKHLIEKESYVTSFPWSNLDSQDALLFSTAVMPVMYDRSSAANPAIYATPLAWVAQLFQFWRGDIIFRFRFIASQYHRGRVRITFDPMASAAQNILTVPNNQSYCFNEIVDLTKDTNVEVRVPYAQALAWCKTTRYSINAALPFTVGNATTYKHVVGTTNGMLTVRCVTALTAPVASSTVNCIVSVRAADNVEFAGPQDINPKYTIFAPQSDEYESTESSMVVTGTQARSAPGRFLVNHGEQVVSLRQLLHRYNYLRTTTTTGATGATGADLLLETFYRMPLSPGYDPTGIHLAKGIVVPASNFNYNFVSHTTISWLAPAFLGARGSVNWVLNVDGIDSVKTMQVARVFDPVVQTGRSQIGEGGPSLNVFANFWANTSGMSISQGGAAANSQLSNASLTFQAPMYSAYKMNVTSPGNASATLSQDDSSMQALRLVVARGNNARANQIHWYVSAGTDFSLHFFLNVPVVYFLSAAIVPV